MFVRTDSAPSIPTPPRNTLFWASIGVAVGFWFIDAAIDTTLLGSGTYVSNLLPAEPMVLYLRVLTCSLLVVVGGTTNYSLKRIRAAQHEEHVARSRLDRALSNFTQFAVDHSPDPAFWVRRDGLICYVNNAACEALEYTYDELVTMTVPRIDPDFPESLWEKHFDDMRRDGQSQFEAHHLSKSGRLYPVEVSTSYLEFEGEEFICAYARDITERKRHENELAKSLRDKEVLLQEIHHRVKNNLQVISSLLYHQSTREDDDRVTAALNESRDRIQAMGLIHEQLYQSDDLRHIDGVGYLKRITDSLSAAYLGRDSEVVITTRGQAPAIDLETAMPIGIIVSELVTNALKYAFNGRGHGHVTVELTGASDPSGTDYEITVSDDGVGLPEDVDLATTKTLGLHLVSLLTEQLHGDVRVSRSGGTTFQVAFRRSNHRT